MSFLDTEETPPEIKCKSSILVTVEIIYEDGNVRIEIRSGSPWADTHLFPLSAKVRAQATVQVSDELKKFMPRNKLA